MRTDKLRSLLLIAGTLAVLLVLLLGPKGERTEDERITVLSPDSVFEIPASPEPTYAGTVGKNTSFFDLMLACKLSPQEIKDIERKAKEIYDFRRIYPGQEYELYTGSDGNLERLTFVVNDEHFIEVTRNGEEIAAERKEYPFEVYQRTASGIITHSLFVSLQEQNLPLELGAKLTDIFAWDIDFFTDVHKNDYFRIIYEEKTRHDGLTKIGHIIAAEFNTKGKSHYAFLFENEAGFADYFDADGKSLRKQLLKAPLSYSRISSSFSSRRYHPVLHHYSPHLGIDYAAPAGTPVQATGDGTVMTATRNKANGKYVKIRHNNNYISYYLHLSRFGPGIKSSVKVKQGQVIGYVGSTGYATGAHLDYRVKKNGRFVNPRSLKLPPAKPVTEENMVAFADLREQFIVALGGIPISDWRTQHYVTGEGSPGGEGEETDEASHTSSSR
jgi:murein DD-endopeptidase MepM/ murein hydrolase activator NlpD